MFLYFDLVEWIPSSRTAYQNLLGRSIICKGIVHLTLKAFLFFRFDRCENLTLKNLIGPFTCKHGGLTQCGFHSPLRQYR